jgi:hypothetical protein
MCHVHLLKIQTTNRNKIAKILCYPTVTSLSCNTLRYTGTVLVPDPPTDLEYPQHELVQELAHTARNQGIYMI